MRSTKKVVPETPSPRYEVELDVLIHNLGHWRHCIIVEPGNVEC